MAVTLNASTSTGFVQSADTSGNLELQSNGSTKLTVNSSGVTATNIQGTIVQGTAVASTSGTSIDFTGIPSWVKRITVMFSGVSTTGTSQYLLQLGDSGGIENTGYVSNTSDGTNAGTSTAGLIFGYGVAAADTMVGQVILSNITGNTWIATGLNYPSSYGTFMNSGSKTLSATLDRIRITTVLGTPTFDAGTINIQYEG